MDRLNHPLSSVNLQGAAMLQPLNLSLTTARLGAVLALVASTLATGVAAAQAANANANASASAEMQCILAGRLDTNARWAPQAKGIELIDAAGKRVLASDKAALASVKKVRVSSPALLSACNGNQPLTKGEETLAGKSKVPAVSAGNALITVEAIHFPALRVGGELVELRLSLSPERIVPLTR
jgi:hypothetical protein